MTFTYDPTTDIGRVRLLVTDTSDERQIFQDEEVQAFLTMCDNDAFLAAAEALDTIAANEALSQQAVTILGLTVNGPAVAKVLQERAQKLRDQQAALTTSAPAFGSASLADDFLQAQETYLKTIWREET